MTLAVGTAVPIASDQNRPLGPAEAPTCTSGSNLPYTRRQRTPESAGGTWLPTQRRKSLGSLGTRREHSATRRLNSRSRTRYENHSFPRERRCSEQPETKYTSCNVAQELHVHKEPRCRNSKNNSILSERKTESQLGGRRSNAASTPQRTQQRNREPELLAVRSCHSVLGLKLLRRRGGVESSKRCSQVMPEARSSLLIFPPALDTALKRADPRMPLVVLQPTLTLAQRVGAAAALKRKTIAARAL